MPKKLLFPLGTSLSCRNAANMLAQARWEIADHPSPEVTHLLLDIPSFRTISEAEVSAVLETLPPSVTVIGGNLNRPCLEAHRTMDLLKDPFYLAENADITARCALVLAAQQLPTTLQDTDILILGWGRIGKCLARLLRSIGADPAVLARKDEDRAMLTALGYRAVSPAGLTPLLPGFRLVMNTVPALVLPEELSRLCPGVKMDLASNPGITGPDVICARGLPGLHAPETTGKLICRTVLRLEGRK